MIKRVFACLGLMLLGLGLVGNLLLQVDTTLSSDNFVTEISGLGFEPYAVDVDSKGNIFVKDHLENEVWRNTDQGARARLSMN